MSELTPVGKFFKGVWYGTVASIILFGFVSCVKELNESMDRESINKEIRAENGGALPGIEAVNANGRKYDVDRITFEGVNYLCFSQGRRMGCMKE